MQEAKYRNQFCQSVVLLWRQ